MDGHPIRVIEYDMSNFLQDKVDKYLELLYDSTGKAWELPKYMTPFLPESQENCKARAPSRVGEDGLSCPWCRHTSPVSEALKVDATLEGLTSKSANRTAQRKKVVLGEGFTEGMNDLYKKRVEQK